MVQGGKRGVRAEIARALRTVPLEMLRDPEQGQARKVGTEEILPGLWLADADGLPPDCPVQVLGREGSLLHLVDAMGQLVTVKPNAFGQTDIQALFHARQNYLYWAWPRFGKALPGAKPKVESWRAEKVRETLYAAAGRKALFSAAGHVRGRGAWRTPKNTLIYHSGDSLWSVVNGAMTQSRPGLVGREFYNLLPTIPAPWPEAVDDHETPARELLAALRTWNFERPDVDPVLMLGWIGAAMLGGALEWRPSCYVTGDKATGKSTLLDLVKSLLGDGMLKSADATAAGVTQALRHDARPVAIDEFEAEAEARGAAQMMKLAKIASSGDSKLRGGADHSGVEFTVRSCFLFSSINPVALRPENVSRLAILRLRPLAEHAGRAAQAPVIDLEITGPMLLRRLIDGWGRFEEAYGAYATVLREAGHADRGQKTFGTLLACADLLLGPVAARDMGCPTVGDLSIWGKLLAPATLAEHVDQSDNWRACLNHLLTSRVEVWRSGQRHTVGQLLDDFRVESANGPDSTLFAGDVRRLLAQAGLGLLVEGAGRELLLAVPNESQLVGQQYRDTRWIGEAGAGVWKYALRQAPPEVIVTDARLNRVRINGVQQRCTLIKLAALEDDY